MSIAPEIGYNYLETKFNLKNYAYKKPASGEMMTDIDVNAEYVTTYVIRGNFFEALVHIYNEHINFRKTARFQFVLNEQQFVFCESFDDKYGHFDKVTLFKALANRLSQEVTKELMIKLVEQQAQIQGGNIWQFQSNEK